MRHDLTEPYYRPVQQTQVETTRRQGRIERAPVRGKPVGVDVSVRFPLPVEKVERERRPLRRAKLRPLLLVVNLATPTFAFRRNRAGTEWETFELSGGDPSAELVSVIYKGGLVTFTTGNHLAVSEDQGETFTYRTGPGGDDIFMHDRAPDGRYWTLDNDDQTVYYSDDEGQSWTSSGAFIDYATAWHLSVHPKDSNRVAVTYEDVSSGDLMVNVTTDRGSGWSTHTVGTFSAGYALWLPGGRLVALVEHGGGDNLSRVFSDDDGASWSSTSLLASNAVPASGVQVADARVTRSGALFAIVNIEPNVSSKAILRSLDGDAFDVLDPHLADLANCLSFYDNTNELFIGYRDDHIFHLRGALTVDAAGWLANAVELDDEPTGVIASNTIHGNMVTM